MPTTVGPQKWLDELSAELGLRSSEPEVQQVGQMQRDVFAHAAEPAVRPAGGGQSFLSSIPPFRDWLNTPEPAPAIKSLVSTLPASFDEWMNGGQQQPSPTPSGTPSAMPAPRRTVEATIQDGRVTPPTSGGDWREMPVVQRGSHPEKQAIVYQEARAAGLDDEGARILVAVTETEGGLTGAIGDEGKSRGPFQFYEGGQMPGFRAWVQQQSIQGDPNDLVHDVRLATRYAASGYLGRAIAAGRAAGLSGADLATYVQQHGQVSVDPWKTGQNYTRLYGGGAAPGAPPQPSAPAPAPVTQQQAPAPPAAQAAPRPAAAAQSGERPPMPQDGRDWVLIRHNSLGHTQWGLRTNVEQYPDQFTVIYDPRQSSMSSNATARTAASSSQAASAGPAAPGSGAGLPPEVAARWRQQFGRDATPDEVAELMGVLM